MDERTVIETLDRTVVEGSEGSAERRIRGWLTVWSGFQKGRDFPLYEGRNFVGSDKRCEICVLDIYFPPFCFNIRIKDSLWMVIDLDSDGGLIVNEESLFRRELQDEDWIKTGNIVFRVKKR